MIRRLAIPTLTALAAAAMSGWAMLVGYAWTDYETANEGPFRALVAGRIGDFLQSAPIEGPSLLLRAPFAFLPSLWGGGDLAVYRTVAVPGLLAGVVLGVLLWEMRRRVVPGARWSIFVVLLAAGNPVTLRALEIGHPEELFGAVLCVTAVLAALWDRPTLAAVLLGFALANKAWAVLAIGPVLLALESRHWRVLFIAGGIATLFVAPFVLGGVGGRSALAQAATTNVVFQPWQVWWFLGEHGTPVHDMFGAVKEDYRAAPAWIGHLTHPLIAFLVVPASLLWRRVHGRARGLDILLLLALLFLARCVLDVANNVYYHLPFLMALLAWEALHRRQPPVLSALAAGAVWVTFEVAPRLVTPDVQSLIYSAWSLPALAWLTYVTLVAPRRPAPVRPKPAVLPVPA